LREDEFEKELFELFEEEVDDEFEEEVDDEFEEGVDDEFEDGAVEVELKLLLTCSAMVKFPFLIVRSYKLTTLLFFTTI